MAEAQHILRDLYLPTRFRPKIENEGSRIAISSVSLFSVAEILARSSAIRDVRLQVQQGFSYHKKSYVKLCTETPWSEWLPPAARVKVNAKSVASHLYHEGMLKELLVGVLAFKGFDAITDDGLTPLTTIFVELTHDRLSVSLSLAGTELYQRGFREIGQIVAPLREDLAHSCLVESLAYCRGLSPEFTPRTLFVPFGGSGTLVFEHLMHEMNLAPCLLGRPFALQELPVFNPKNFAFIMRQAAQRTQRDTVDKIVYLDHAEAACTAYEQNSKNFKAQLAVTAPTVSQHLAAVDWTPTQGDFLTQEVALGSEDVFVPLNPPYGLRFRGSQRPEGFYGKIAARLVAFRRQLPATKHLGGFVLCPNEATWGSFLKHLNAPHTHTYHVSQGGQDIRVCQFLL